MKVACCDKQTKVSCQFIHLMNTYIRHMCPYIRETDRQKFARKYVSYISQHLFSIESLNLTFMSKDPREQNGIKMYQVRTVFKLSLVKMKKITPTFRY